DLPARDTLLPRAHWFLARAHQERGENILAATSFTHLVESFPNDTLSDDAALEAARSYRKMWRKPSLDPTYGQTAEATYTTLLGLFPDSPLIPTAKAELDSLEDMFAQKNYLTGMYYFRREAYDPGMIYFKDILLKWPTTPTARIAQLRLVEAYKAIKYKPEAAEGCAMLKKSFPDDAEVRTACTGVDAPLAASSASPPPATTGPPAKERPATPPAF
ncbi:MAG: outer rane assembly lipoprotein YfiO, partial [Gemmatimonadetes bacterium]|nr:outer rane assembly lipoprotein YfiO [Gemmatimonadota bacterium]